MSAGEPFRRSWHQNAVIIPFTRLFERYFRARTHGAERIPDRPVIFVGKHPKGFLYLETMLLCRFAYWDAGRPAVRVMEKTGTSMHKLPVFSWIRRHVGGIPATEEAARAALARGESLLVFPGGPRELYGPPDTLQWNGRRGFSRLAQAAQVPVVPFAIAGADQQHPWRIPLGKKNSLWFPPVPLPVALDFHYGEPIPPPPAGDPEAVIAHSDAVRAATEALLAEATARRRKPWSL